MNVTDEKARQSLSMVENISSQARKSIAAGYASPLLIIWGIICIVCFLGTYFFVERANEIWYGVGGLGMIGTFLICRRQAYHGKPTKIDASKKAGWRMFWFWTLLFIYIYLWLSIVKPRNGIQLNAFIIVVIMFAYIVIGLWHESNFMIGLGLFITAVTMIGVYLIAPAYYCLWMAPTAGGALLGTGFYLRLRWK